jgi:hypothetical protein
MLTAATPVLTPGLKYYYPDGTQPFEATNHITFTVGPNQGATISSSGIQLILNGVDVTSGLTLTQNGGTWTGSYPILSNAVYTASINVTNGNGLGISKPLSFDTFSITNYQWEAVDYDFSEMNDDGTAWVSGMFIDNPVPSCDVNAPQTGEMATNSYFAYPTGFNPGVDPNGVGAIAQQGIDINFPNDGQSLTSEYYRADGVGSQPASDYVRPKFIAAQTEFSDPNIGPINIGYYGGGYWLNYTRHYPTGNWYVWGRLAGGGGPIVGTSVSNVVSGVGTVNQTLSFVGTFSDPNAAGWQTWHWVPMHDANGNPAVVQLGGKSTLRVTSGGNVNTEFFMLTPAPLTFSVTASIVSGQLKLSFPTETGYNYQVLYKSALPNANWTPVGSAITGNGSPGSATESLGTQGFYEVVAQPN